MVTKKWVEEKIVEVEGKAKREIGKKSEAIEKDIVSLQKGVGYKERSSVSAIDYRIWLQRPDVSMAERLDAICAYLGIEIVKEEKEENIVAKKIKKAK
jgi:hypothetical protein